MLKMLFLLFLLISSVLHADQEVKSSLSYVKLGVNLPPDDLSIVLPSFGLGTRFQSNNHGFDLSANLGSLVFINYASIKGIFLFFPQPEKRDQLYFGFGLGIGYYLMFAPMGGPFGGSTTEYGSVALEGVLGYEFRHTHHFKTFIQLELSQPIFGFGKNRHSCSCTPGVALTGGFGF